VDKGRDSYQHATAVDAATLTEANSRSREGVGDINVEESAARARVRALRRLKFSLRLGCG